MADEKHILLLDIDGVLLQPGGYREAVKATINHFTRQAGLSALAPDEEVFAFFESRGITNEWDMIPIYLAIIFESILEMCPELILPEDWESAAANIIERAVILKPIRFKEKIDEIAQNLKVGKSPSNAIYEVEVNQPGWQPFPQFGKQLLFSSLFRDNKDVANSLATRLFQNYVLGSLVFQEIYLIDPLIETSSFLDLYDRRQLSEWNCRQILRHSKAGKISPVAYSARPSLPPEGVKISAGYSPEAEMALKLVELPGIPLIAYGRLRYAAQLLGVPTDTLIKPSPFQALSAIIVASMPKKDEKKALLAAGVICRMFGRIPDADGSVSNSQADVSNVLQDLRACNLVVDVVEDSPIGIRAVKEAGEILSSLNIPVEFRAWGVARDAAKKRALEMVGASVSTSTDEIITSILRRAQSKARK